MSTRPPLRHRVPSRLPGSAPPGRPGPATRSARRRVRRRPRRPEPGPLLLAERAAALFPPASSAGADAVSEPVSGPRVLQREVAVAAARDAVRRSRLRRQHVPERGRSRAGPEGVPSPAPAEAPEPGPAAQRARSAPRVWERLPLWVRLRCGMELRTVLALAVVLCAALVLAVHHFWSGRPQTVRAPEARPPAHTPGSGSPEARASGGGRKLVVDVTGKVREPGVYRLPAGSRVEDALAKAGGVRPGTDVRSLNRARLLVDGEQITAGGPPGAAPAAGGGAAAPSGAPVSLNTATAEQLETLPGVGPVLAQHLIEFREENGGFTSVSQLREVNGIGDRRFADLESQVRP